MDAIDHDRAARAIVEFLRALGAPVDSDPELRETGKKVADAFADELLAGYRMDPAAILAEATEAQTKGLVVLGSIPTTAMCPHHLLPAPGVVHVGYLPGSRVVGLGALGQLVQCFARRLILQEELGESIVDALMRHLDAEGAACLVELAPMCVTARGGRYHGARAITSAYAGRLADDTFRREFLSRLPSPTPS